MHRNVTPSTMAREAAPKRPLIEMPAHLEAMIHTKPRRMVVPVAPTVSKEGQAKIDYWKRTELELEREEKRVAAALADAVEAKKRLKLQRMVNRFGPNATLDEGYRWRRGQMPLISQRYCYVVGISLGELKSPCRRKDTAEPRQRLMWMLSSNGPFSLCHIGRYFNRDHTTVLHALRKVKDSPEMLAKAIEERDEIIEMFLKKELDDAKA